MGTLCMSACRACWTAHTMLPLLQKSWHEMDTTDYSLGIQHLHATKPHKIPGPAWHQQCKCVRPCVPSVYLCSCTGCPCMQESEVAPVIAGYWEKAEFPFKLVPSFAKLGLAGGSIRGYGCPVRDSMIAPAAPLRSCTGAQLSLNVTRCMLWPLTICTGSAPAGRQHHPERNGRD